MLLIALAVAVLVAVVVLVAWSLLTGISVGMTDRLQTVIVLLHFVGKSSQIDLLFFFEATEYLIISGVQIIFST